MTDEVTIKIKAGRGGDGAVSFLRQKFRPMGGPDGGDGGNGGSIIFIADNNVNTLTFFDSRKHFEAENGQDGMGKNLHGKSGSDLILKVPQGTIFYQNKKKVADLLKVGQEFVVAKGGNGGWGNQHFASSIKQKPEWSKKGLFGEEKELKLELKLIADVGIIGLPNVGKSTLLSVISNARPKIADYPFTTLEPNLGVVKIYDKEFIFADIPGLIEGASVGRGLGDKFLRHIERTKEILILVSAESSDPVADYQTLIKELADYSKKLAKKKFLVAISKSEIIDEKRQTKIAADFKKEKISPIFFSSATSKNLDLLLKQIYGLSSK
ncbi:MAG: GTP-binding protein [Candidatus Berkelbacteria bacterium Athens1014_28]|uniref:GTPase Obg n=1 Tax=Candidatus Berkelbacteria bacterium Athens1014_28 TaxID=2017145 RepID=A0A554LN43_9BACT|nr:MAG: GTP-binding protein [Candidatus Berkelbacteria bacterium Athens1014_28]